MRACLAALLLVLSAGLALADDAITLAARESSAGHHKVAIALLMRSLREHPEPSVEVRTWAAIGKAWRAASDESKAVNAWKQAVQAFAPSMEAAAAEAAAGAEFELAELELDRFRATPFVVPRRVEPKDPQLRDALSDEPQQRFQKALLHFAGLAAKVRASFVRVVERYGPTPSRAPALARVAAAGESLADGLVAVPCPREVRAVGIEACSTLRAQALEVVIPLLARTIGEYAHALAEAGGATREHYAITEARLALCRLDPARCPPVKP